MKNMDILLIKDNCTIKQAMSIIDRGEIKTAFIIEKDMNLTGVVSDGDIRRALMNGMDINASVKEIMTRNPIKIDEIFADEDIRLLMKEKVINVIPITNTSNQIVDIAVMSVDGNLNFFNKHKSKPSVPKKILVIGGAGFIGSILTKKLLDKNYGVVVLDNFLYVAEALNDLKNNKKLEIIRGDTKHIEDISKSMENVDAVVNLAELVGDPACALNPRITVDTNYFATSLVAQMCKRHQINRLIYMSSCSVYGASEKDELLHENSKLNPVSLYAKMKIESEKKLRELSDDNFKPTIFRLSTVFGLSPRPRFDLVVNIFISKAVKDKKITVFGGDQWRPNVHAADVSDAIILALEAPLDIVGGEIFNVGSEELNYTINDLARIVSEEVVGCELVIEDKLVDKRNYKCDFSKIRTRLGFKPKLTLKDAIVEIKNEIESGKLDPDDIRYNNLRFLNEKLSKT